MTSTTISPVQRIDCTRFSLRGHKGMASQGYGQCALVTGTGHFESATFERHCAHFNAASPDVMRQRRDWLQGARDKFHRSIDEAQHDFS